MCLHINYIECLGELGRRDAYRIWFQVSGTPPMHQCVQSNPCKPLYILGCPSFLSCVSLVISSKYTGFDIFLRTCFTIFTGIGKPLGYVDPFTGVVSLKQFFTFGSPHSDPLKKLKKEF